jgi:tetratricopeptide (TPR) repeat protein
MKRILFFIVLLISFKTIAQNNSKIAFQKSRYELALSYYKKADLKKAIDLFYVASKIKPDNEIGQESIKKVDTIKTILRENIMSQALGTWKMVGDKPIWAANQSNANALKDFDEIVEIKENEILFYEKNKKTQEKKLIKTEKLAYYNKEESDALFSDIILSDGTIWNCTVNETSDQLHVINVGKTGENGIEKIISNNMERFYIKVK